MKNIETILGNYDLADDIKTAIITEVNANYKTIAEFEKKETKISNLAEKLSATEQALKQFDGVNAEEMTKTIDQLKRDLDEKDASFKKQLADRDFNDLLANAISTAKGKNAKAITALLDVETLKSSQNQKEDVANAIKALADAEDSKFLFDVVEQGPKTPVGIINPIGSINHKSQTSYLDDKYKNNPYYHPNN